MPAVAGTVAHSCATLWLTKLSCPRSVRCGGAAEGRLGRERLPDGVLDRTLLLLPLGHADLTAPQLPHLRGERSAAPRPSQLFCYCNQRSALHSPEFLSVRPSALSGWGVHSFILVKEKKKSLFNICKTFVVTLKNALAMCFSQRHSDEISVCPLKFS